MFTSIILPTYNRVPSLRRTLESFEQQTLDPQNFEVVLVDDGSQEPVQPQLPPGFRFHIHVIRQVNQGDAVARNTGALAARGELLVFVDDDIIVQPGFLENMLATLQRKPRTIVVGNLLPPPGHTPLINFVDPAQVERTLPDQDIPFTRILSGFMGIRREHYYEIGMMQSLTGKGPDAWCDVDFAYRAHLRGFHFVRSLHAVGYHYDAAAENLDVLCRRLERASRSATILFHKYPELQEHIRMFEDKTPISLREDPPALIVQKAWSILSAFRPVQWGMEQVVRGLEKHKAGGEVRKLLYRWISSSYIYKGYRHGLRDQISHNRASLT
jgi:glycosyltransferase involved in cell wall biosynthesis